MLKLTCENKAIHMHLSNERQSMLITGKSRYGKTFFGLLYAEQLARQGSAVHMIDLGDKWSDRDRRCLKSFQSFPKNQVMKIYFLSENDLLDSIQYFAQALGYTSNEVIRVLRNAVKGLLLGEKRMFDFQRLIASLQETAKTDNNGKRVFEKFDSFGEIPHVEVYIDAEQSRKMAETCSVWNLSIFEGGYVSCVAQLILSAIFSVNKAAFRERTDMKRVYAVIDEFQNLKWTQKSILGTYLTEGAKYGCYLILLTQYLTHKFSEGVLNQLQQVGFQVCFCLTDDDAAYVAKQLAVDIETQKEIKYLLCHLEQGYFILKGPHSVGESKLIAENIRLVHVEESVDRKAEKTIIFVPEKGRKGGMQHGKHRDTDLAEVHSDH